MTDETKRTLLEYMSGKLESSCGDERTDSLHINKIEKNIDTILREQIVDLKDWTTAFLTSRGDYLLFFINTSDNENVLEYHWTGSYILVLDKNYTFVKLIDSFSSGTKFFRFSIVDEKNTDKIYFIDNETQYAVPSDIVVRARLCTINDFTLTNFNVNLLTSFNIPKYNDNILQISQLIKKENDNKYFMVYSYDINNLSESYGGALEFVNNVGSENEWNFYPYNGSKKIKWYGFKKGEPFWKDDKLEFKIFCDYESTEYNGNTVKFVLLKNGENESIELYDFSLPSEIKNAGQMDSCVINNNKVYLSTTTTLSSLSNTVSVIEYDLINFSSKILYYKDDYIDKEDDTYFYDSYDSIKMVKINSSIYFLRNYVYHKMNKTTFEFTDIINDLYLYQVTSLGLFDYYVYNLLGLNAKNETLSLNNVYNLNSIDVIYSTFVIQIRQVYNDLNYNGTPCIQPNSLVANSGILYQDNMPVFARNLYNKSLNDNLTVSTIEVPNNYLNNILVNKEVLKSKTNLSLVDKSEQIIKNEYENVYVNFLNAINMRNENDPQKPVSNLTGAIRVNNSINLENDVDNTKVTKCKIVYDSGKEVVKNIQVDLANNTVTGSNPTLTNCLNKKLNYLKVEGKTVQNGTPTPDTPIEIDNVKGYSNLLDETLINKSDSTYWVTDKVNGINIQANKDYYFTTYTSMSVIRVLELGTDKVIKEVTDTIELTFNVENATKVYFTIYKAENIPTDTKILFIKGNTQIPYVPYGSNYLELKANSENLFDKDNISEINAYINNTTKILTSDAMSKTIYIPCEPNTTYTISRTLLGERFNVSSSNKTPTLGMQLEKVSGSYFNNTSYSITYTTNANDKYLMAFIYNGGVDKKYTYEEITNGLQIEKGDKATEYEQYQANSTLVNLQSNEICEGDTLIVQNGYASIDKNKKILELTGEENWTFPNQSQFPNLFQILYDGDFSKALLENQSKCSHFTFTTDLTKDGYRPIYSSDKSYLRIVNNKFTTIADFKQWLKDQKANGTPVIVQYELANKENIGLGLQEQLTAYSNVTYVSCNDNLQPNLEVNYLINENYSTLSTTIYVDELLKELQFISNDEKTVYQTIDISNLQVGNYYTINQRMEVK